MVCGPYKAIFIDVDKMDQLKVININTGVDTRYSRRQVYIPLISGHMIPGTDSKLMLEFYDSQFVTLRTVETGQRQILIQGSPNGMERNNYPCSFFLKCGDGYELHFCTFKQEKGTNVISWYRWFLGKDFFKMLDDFGRLPLEMSLNDVMQKLKESEQKDEKIAELENKLKQR